MKKFYLIIGAIVISSVMFLAACEEGGAEDSGQTTDGDGGVTSMSIGSAPSTTSWYTYFTAVSNTINSNSDSVETTVSEEGGTIVNAVNLANGEQDIGFTMSDIAYDSYNGEGQFGEEGENPSNENLRMMWNIAPTQMHWAVAESEGIESLEELDGEEFNPSSIGGGGEYITFSVFEALGIEPDYQRMQLEEAGEQVQNGRIVGFSYNGDAPIPQFTQIDAQQPLKVLGLSDEQMEVVLDEYPYFIPTTIPGGSYSGTPEDVQTLGLYTGVATNSTVDEAVIYEMTKQYWENIDQIIESFPAAEEVTIEQMLDILEVPLHTGSIQYYEEEGYEIPEHLIVD